MMQNIRICKLIGKYLEISVDGRYVLFASFAEDLMANDSNHQQDIFVSDVQTGLTTLVSVNSAGTASGNFGSTYGVMTPDGRYVAFRSAARNLVAI
ncbi:MAG: hypothetical protein LC802_11300 [Acidobacteria bacterium]|nr:hypothetical protein [Acidobacteriota bacterium]